MKIYHNYYNRHAIDFLTGIDLFIQEYKLEIKCPTFIDTLKESKIIFLGNFLSNHFLLIKHDNKYILNKCMSFGSYNFNPKEVTKDQILNDSELPEELKENFIIIHKGLEAFT